MRSNPTLNTYENYAICSFIRSNRVRDSWVKLIFTSVCGGAVGFLSINDQICIHGVKSKLSSTFYQLLQASLIYLSKLFAILSLLNILKEIEFQSSKFQKGKNLSYYWIYMLWKTLESYFRHLINVYKQEFIFLVYTPPLPLSNFFFKCHNFFGKTLFLLILRPCWLHKVHKIRRFVRIFTSLAAIFQQSVTWQKEEVHK